MKVFRSIFTRISRKNELCSERITDTRRSNTENGITIKVKRVSCSYLFSEWKIRVKRKGCKDIVRFITRECDETATALEKAIRELKTIDAESILSFDDLPF